jgi:hypothetical protein
MKAVNLSTVLYASPDTHTTVVTTQTIVLLTASPQRTKQPHMRHLCNTCVEHVFTPASYKHSPKIGGVSDHALTTHTYRGIEAIDPYTNS